jgi:hypothetical protein
MINWGLIGLIILSMIFVIAFLIKVFSDKNKDNAMVIEKKYIGLSTAISLPLGCIFGILIDDLSFGIAVSIGIGIAIGSVLYSRNKIITLKNEILMWKMFLTSLIMLAIFLFFANLFTV